MSLNYFCIILACFMKSSFRVFDSTIQGEERQGKRVRVNSPYREESIDEVFPTMHMGGPSQPHRWPEPRQEQSTDSTDDERNLVSFVDIMNAATDVGSEFEGGRHSLNRWSGLWFSDESSETEYSSATEVSNATSSSQLRRTVSLVGV